MPISQYSWDPVTRRYRVIGSGKFVRAQEVREEVDTVIDYWETKMKQSSVQLVKGTLSLGEWQDMMADGLKSLHLSAAAAANGGFANLDRSDLDRISGTLLDEYGHLQDFAEQMASGDQPLNGMVLVRSNMYINGARTTYEDANRQGQQSLGMSLERNVEDSGAAHCGECGDLSDQGWVDIGTLPLPGDRECGPNCRCTLEYSQGTDEESDVT